MATVCTICARGGSVGVPRKNVRDLLGKPLIAWSIEQALASPIIDEVYVSTEDEEIAEVAEAFGACVPYRRPQHLAGPEAGKVAAIQHLVEQIEKDGTQIDTIVDLDPTSPLRTISDICNARKMLSNDVDAVITGYVADKNPYFNMVALNDDDTVGLVMKGSNVLSRQMAPTVYAMNASIYVWHRATLSKGLWNGRTVLFEMPRERSVDIDSELDFRIVEMLMTEREGMK